MKIEMLHVTDQFNWDPASGRIIDVDVRTQVIDCCVWPNPDQRPFVDHFYGNILQDQIFNRTVESKYRPFGIFKHIPMIGAVEEKIP